MTALHARRRHATLIKAAEDAWRLFSQPNVAGLRLNSSALTLHDETGFLPSAYQPTSEWNTHAYGNFTRLIRGAYACLNVRWRFDEKHSLPAAALQMEEEMRTAFQGPELPFVFGYGWRGGCVRDGKARAGSNGVMLTAWRQSWQAGAVT